MQKRNFGHRVPHWVRGSAIPRLLIPALFFLHTVHGASYASDSTDGSEDHTDIAPHAAKPADFLLAQNTDNQPQKSVNSQASEIPAKPYRDSRLAGSLTTRLTEAGGIGYKHGYTTAAGLMFYNPDYKRCTSWFMDLRAHEMNNNTQATNIGIGIRNGFLWINRVLGGNIFYDYRNTRHYNYQQLGLGLELLGKGIDIRANGYIPFGVRSHQLHRCKAYDRTGTYFIERKRYEFALGGMDLEVGLPIKKWRLVSWYGAIGAYYYTSSCDSPFGGKLRLNFRFMKSLFLEGVVSHDNVFGTRAQGIIGYTFAFGKISKSRASKKNCNYARKIAVQPIQRQEIIVVDRNCRWKWNF
jgi:hypothetical protein